MVSAEAESPCEDGSTGTTHRSAGTTSNRYREAKTQREEEVARLVKLVNVHGSNKKRGLVRSNEKLTVAAQIIGSAN
jgi:hypothetical protein